MAVDRDNSRDNITPVIRLWDRPACGCQLPGVGGIG